MMTQKEKELIAELLLKAMIGIMAGVPFAVWQGSAAAGLFMTVFVMVMVK